MYRVWGGGAVVRNAAYQKLDTADLDDAWLPLIERGDEGDREMVGRDEEDESGDGSDSESDGDGENDYDLDSDSIGSISNSNCSSGRSNNGDVISINPLLAPHRRESGGNRGSDDTDGTPTAVQGVSTALRPRIQRSRNRSNSALSHVSSLDGNTDQNTRTHYSTRNFGIGSRSYSADPGSKHESSNGMHAPSSSSSSSRNLSSKSQSRVHLVAMREYQQRLHGSTVRESRSGSGSDTYNTQGRGRSAVSSFVTSSSAVCVDKDRGMYNSIINYHVKSGKSE
jgi:hypothetical protein